ncbi:MAG: arginyltransferase [Ponticaulis sp.]|nr:arginyltransferase [Ponticaulis sp.]|tara:strand:- start:20140 stop:20898 length:759 start_codon:yes stop_codon:yes gene_type:complete
MKIIDSPAVRGIANRQLRFYMTNPAPCPYLEGKSERKVFTNLAVSDAELLHDALSHSGFRRSQSIAYRPACTACNACRATRIPVADFSPTKRWRRVLKKNASLIREPKRPTATREQYNLLKRYLDGRHAHGGMAGMNLRDYVSMVEGSPVPTVVFEYREGPEPDSTLIAAALVDVLKDGLSMVYSFFEPERATQSMGNFIILDHIAYAQELNLDYVYLGYWVESSPKMGYKADFRPLEILDGDEWRILEDEA